MRPYPLPGGFRGSFARLPAALALAIPLCAGAAQAEYPSRPLRLLVSEVGAQVDLVARQLAPGLAAALRQPVVIDNRPGFLSVETAVRALPDGHTLVMYTNSVWIVPLLQKVSFDAVRDLAPVTLVGSAPLFLLSQPSVPAKTVKEFVSVAKAKPGALNYGSSAAGTSGHLAGELFKSMANVDIVRVPYKGTGAAVTGLLANEVQLVFGSAAAGLSHVRNGRLNALAVGSLQRSAFAPDVPTVSESGLPGYEAASQACLWAPARTPRSVVMRVNRETVAILRDPETRSRLLASGIEAIGNSPEEIAAYIRRDIQKWERLIASGGIKAD